MNSEHVEFRTLVEQAHMNLHAMLLQLSDGEAPEEEALSAREALLSRLSEFHAKPELWEKEVDLVHRLIEAEQRWVQEIKRLRETTSQELERLRAHRQGVNRYVGA